MKHYYLEKLEYYNILEQISTYTCTYIGKKQVLSTLPSFSYEEVISLQNKIYEAFSFIQKFGFPPLTDIANIADSLNKLKSNYTLSIKNILEINHILKLSNELQKHFYSNADLDINNFVILNQLFSNLYVNKPLIQEINNCFLDENTVDDRASNKLFELRKKSRNLEKAIKEKLHSIIHSSKNSKYIQEPVITIRNDRYVIPVKEEFKSFIKGLIHDISASGSTVFIEPISVFEINNEINNLKMEEHLEIERILMEFSNKLSNITDQLDISVKAIGDIDFLFAKAKYSRIINATPPILNRNKLIHLIEARNPIIDKNLVVPITVQLGNDFQTLVITGPNTGGKTVTLKTVGLLLLMAYSGLYIPAKENSSIPVFDNIFADIGDEQSIQESLSTFSSHIKNIINIINNANSNCLILLDELGSGTDPIEGSSLAISLLEYFHNLNCITIATTHYQEIKEYALTTKGFENASSEFDIENLKPTYHLILGVPGKSNAFEISKKLGLSPKIIERAKYFVNSGVVNIEELLKNIYDNKLHIENEKEEINKKLNQINLLKNSLENKTKEIEKKKKQIIDTAKKEARKILLDAKEEASFAIKEINRIQNLSSSSNIKDLNQIRNKLNLNIKSVDYTEDFNYAEKNSKKSYFEIIPNIEVYISNLNQYGTVLSISKNSNDIQVQIGNNKLTINKQFLIPTKNNNFKKASTTKIHYTTNLAHKNIATEINLLGTTVEEAIFSIDKFLDNATLQKINTVRIIHGKGTGSLKKGIHNFLKSDPRVKSYRLGSFGEGEMGVTIVEIK